MPRGGHRQGAGRKQRRELSDGERRHLAQAMGDIAQNCALERNRCLHKRMLEACETNLFKFANSLQAADDVADAKGAAISEDRVLNERRKDGNWVASKSHPINRETYQNDYLGHIVDPGGEDAELSLELRRWLLDGKPDSEYEHRRHGYGRVFTAEVPKLLGKSERAEICKVVSKRSIELVGAQIAANKVDRIWKRLSPRPLTEEEAVQLLLSRQSSEDHLCRDILSEAIVEEILQAAKASE